MPLQAYFDVFTGAGSRRNSGERTSSSSVNKRRRSSDTSSPRRHSKENISPGGASESNAESAQSSAQKTRASMHVQFDVTPDTGFMDTSSTHHHHQSAKDRYCKTYPPTPAVTAETNVHKSVDPESMDKKTKRVPVSDRLKSSSVDYMDSSPAEHVLSSSPKEGFKKLERALEGGQISKEDLMKFAFEKGMFSKDDIMKLVSKPHKRKSNLDMLSSPLKAFSTEEMGLDSESSSRKHSPSRIPVFTGKSKNFDSSSDSVDLPDIKESLQEQQHPQNIELSSAKSDTLAKTSLRKSASLKHSSSDRRKLLDSSESEVSPQVSPCNTSSGMSLSGTTGSDSSSDVGKKNKHAKKESQHRRHHSTSSLKDLDSLKKQEQVSKVCLTRPNPPPIPPPSEKISTPLKADHTESVVKDSYRVESGCKGENPKLKTAKSSSLSANTQSEEVVLSGRKSSSSGSAARLSTDTYVLDKSELAEIRKSAQDSLGKSPSSQSLHSFEHDYPLMRSPERSPKPSKEHGYKPSFFPESSSSTSPSRKIFLRREGSFGQMSDPGDDFQDTTSAGVIADPFLVSDDHEQVQKIVQSDGTVTYASYRKVSFDRASDADMESLDGSQTISIPGLLAQDEEQHKPPPSPKTIRKGSTCIDSDDGSEGQSQRSRRGRVSQRSSRKRSKERKKEKGEKRASSVGALMRKLSIKRERDREKERNKDIVAEKPPKPPTPPTGRSPSRDVETEHRGHKSERRRTKSETVSF